jgi:hypothetical protein
MAACSAGFSLILFDEHGETRKTIEIRFFLATFGSGFFLSFLAFQIFKRPSVDAVKNQTASERLAVTETIIRFQIGESNNQPPR